MKVKSWISYEEAKEYREAPCGGMGGFFNWDRKGMRWKDFVGVWDPECVPYLEAIRESVVAKKKYLTGADHQHQPDGVPLFEDDRVSLFTYRGWGDLMAAIWSEEEDRDYSYIDFYM